MCRSLQPSLLPPRLAWGRAPEEGPLPRLSIAGLAAVFLHFHFTSCHPVLNVPAKALRSAASHQDKGPRHHPPTHFSIINTVPGTQDVVEEIDRSPPFAKLHCNKDVKTNLTRLWGAQKKSGSGLGAPTNLGSGLSPALGCQPTSAGPMGSPSPGFLFRQEEAGLRPQGINTTRSPRRVRGAQSWRLMLFGSGDVGQETMIHEPLRLRGSPPPAPRCTRYARSALWLPPVTPEESGCGEHR